MKINIKNNIYSNISIEKLLVISKIKCFNNVNILINLIIIQTRQLDI